MPIERKLFKKDFAISPRSISRDTELSYEALGLLTHLLSFPDSWEICKKNLYRKGCHRDRLNRLFKELQSSGYLKLEYVREKNRIINKKWVATNYI